MILIRHLAVLGALAALAMAHPSAANKSKNKSSKHMSKKPKSKTHTMAHPSTGKRSKGKGDKSKSKGDKSKSNDEKSKSKGEESKSKGDESKSKDEKSKSKGDESKSKGKKSKSKGEESKSGKSKKHHKDECPCFDEGDLDSFLSFAAETDSCYYSESIFEDSTSLYVIVDYLSHDNIFISRSLGADSFDYNGIAGGYCSSSLSASGTDPTSPFDTKIDEKGSEEKENKSSLMVTTEIFSECQALIEDLKGPMEALGCVIYSSVYPCPFPCVNGDCTEDGCSCYAGWTGDSCEECDESECVNGVCTVSGCVCDENFAGPPCTECVFGWTGDNCDECDPSACLNGICTDTGCVCNVGWTGTNCDYCDVGWTGPNCDTCDFGWTGNNCDACDPGLCADGYCSSCKNGQCTTGSGCVCDAGWFGDKCDRVYGDGCPCFNEADVEYFLNFAEIARASLGYCYYEENTYTDVAFYLSLFASSYSGTSSSIFVSDTQCSSFRMDGIYVSITAEEAGECRDVILNTDAKEQMEAFGCDIYENTGIEGEAPEPLINGK